MKTNRLPAFLTILIVSVTLDRFTKVWAVRELKGEGAQSYLNDFFRLVYAENTGAFLSMGSGLSDQLRYWILTILPILVLLYVLYLILFASDMNRKQMIAFSFILAGGASNVFDRIMQGSVVDFLNMGFDGLRTGIFNVADMSIMLGLFLMIPQFFQKPNNPTQQSTDQTNHTN
ncbi:MAG: signal peptidase II [Saprospiraceae bacterium]|nr:signal peptidase II [Saprospiraceae bacterium]